MTDTGLETRTLGRTGMNVTRLGYGAMSLDPGRLTPVTDEQAETILNAVLDAGINFMDTSPDYGPSEEFIGRFIAGRRSEFFIATKAGCPVLSPSGEHDYSHANIIAAVEQSLRRMHTDYLDLVEFHGTPSRRVLEELGAADTLLDLKRQGKVRFIGASSTLPRLNDLLEMGVFDAFQIPYSALQREHEAVITAASKAGAGTIIRGGAVRGAPSKDWDVRRLPEVEPARPQAYWDRAHLDEVIAQAGMSRMEFTLRFTFSHPDLDTAIVGTANPDHLAANVEAFRKGPLPADLLAETKRRLDAAAVAGSK